MQKKPYQAPEFGWLGNRSFVGLTWGYWLLKRHIVLEETCTESAVGHYSPNA